MKAVAREKTVTIPKAEYRHLLEVQDALNRLQKSLTEHLFLEPPTRSAKRMIEGLKAHGRHSSAALRGIERGLKESRYFSA